MADLIQAGVTSYQDEKDLLDLRPGHSLQHLPGVLGFLWRKVATLGGWRVANRAALTALVKASLVTTAAQAGVDEIRVTVADDGDGAPRTYRWDAASTATAGANVLASDEGGAGRWIAVAGDLGASGDLPDLRADAATTAALAASTYDNGTAGVGATLTADANGALGAIDGVTLSVGGLLLVKDQGTALQNGLYEVTDLGDGSSPFILTRATTFDEPGEIAEGVGIYVRQGTVNADRAYYLQTNGTITIGTTSLTFATLPNVASQITVADAGSYYSGANVEAVLQEIGPKLANVTQTLPAAAGDQITNTTDPTAFATQFDLSGAAVGEVYKVQGMVVTPATNSTDTFGLDLKIGAAVTLASIAGFDVANGDLLIFDGEITIAVVGASGKVHFRGTATKKAGGTVTTADFTLVDQAVDFTASPGIGLVGTWSVADPGNTADLRLLRVERYAAP